MKTLELISLVISGLLILFAIICKLFSTTLLHTAPISFVILAIPFIIYSIYFKISGK
ncbi:hypothetical protein J7L48_10090 [bacterium]|nr:hypothetical protein [bacterium]